MNLFAAIDIGGTAIKYGVVTQEGKVLCQKKIPTEAYHGGCILMQKVIHLVEELQSEYPTIEGIGVSTAGQVNPIDGSILFATETLPGWTGMEVSAILQKHFNLPVQVENDVNAAALGEAWQGAGKQAKNFLCLTIGTGIGGAIVLDDQLYRGEKGIAAEFGHIPIVPDGRPCTCGNKGCFEQYASTTALVREVQSIVQQKEIDGRWIFQQAQLGNQQCQEAIDQWVKNIAIGLTTLTYIFNPSLIVIGGGISAQGESLMQQIQEHLQEMLMPSFYKGLKVRSASCGNTAGMLGAVYSLLMRKKLNQCNYSIIQ
ncbi:ROK family protein [Algivirga pacifica]|uniref:ROK family protein n=1 Tax=Algivirga pacifica TaxID=1162670 RepID=A0ABP9D460_9BACT